MPKLTGKAAAQSIRRKRLIDEAVLDMLAARATYTTPEIGELFGVSAEHVRIATNRVAQDDLAWSGEPREAVLAAYPWSRA